jgi:hypothetical protein
MKTLITALTLGTLIAAATTPGFAQRSEQQPHMNAAREKALHECSAAAAKYRQSTWGHQEIDAYRTCMMQHGEPEP